MLLGDAVEGVAGLDRVGCSSVRRHRAAVRQARNGGAGRFRGDDQFLADLQPRRVDAGVGFLNPSRGDAIFFCNCVKKKTNSPG